MVLSLSRNVLQCYLCGLQDVTCNLYGSVCSGFALKSSDINIDLSFADEKAAPTCLIKVLKILQNSGKHGRFMVLHLVGVHLADRMLLNGRVCDS